MSDYEVQDVVDSMAQQIGAASLRASLAEARLKKAEERVAELQEQLSAAMADLTALADEKAAKPRTPRST